MLNVFCLFFKIVDELTSWFFMIVDELVLLNS